MNCYNILWFKMEMSAMN